MQTVKNDLSEFNGTTLGWHDGMLLDKRENPYLNDTIKYEQLIDWRTRRAYNVLRLGGCSPLNGSCIYDLWMSENLDYDYKENGESFGSYVNTKRNPAWGRYYRWNVAQKVCPEGWRLPSMQEWNILKNTFGLYINENVKGVFTKDGVQDATNASGFSLIPTGVTYSGSDSFEEEGYMVALWSSSVEESTSHPYTWHLTSDSEQPAFSTDFGSLALPARCVKQDTVIVP